MIEYNSGCNNFKKAGTQMIKIPPLRFDAKDFADLGGEKGSEKSSQSLAHIHVDRMSSGN